MIFFAQPSRPRRAPALASAAFLALCALGIGCTDKTNVAVAPKPFVGVTLRIAVEGDPAVRALLQRHGKHWADETGAKFELVPSDASAEVRVFRPSATGREVSRLKAIDASALRGLEAWQYNRFLRHELDHDMDWGGRIVALPLLGESLFGVYRADLFEAPKHAAELERRFKDKFHFPMRPSGPATWQQVAEIAAYFAAQPNRGPSLPPLPSSPVEFDREFHAIAASFVRRGIKEEKAAALPEVQKPGLLFSYQFNYQTGAPAIAGDGFVAALQLMQQMQAYRPKGTAERPLEAFRSGKAVFALATLADLAWLQEPDSAVRDRFAICRVPGSDTAIDPVKRTLQPVAERDGNLVPYHGHGGWVGGILAIDQTAAAAANDLLMYLSSPAVSLEIACEPSWGGGPTRTTHLDNRSGWSNYALNKARTDQLIDALAGYYQPHLLNPAYALRVADEALYVRRFAEHVQPALTEGKKADAALKDVATAWAAVAKDRDKFLAEYRASLGLK